MFQIKVVNGVIIVSWRQKVLERQIDYGAKLGHVVLSLAKMELNNFYKNVMPVADYFDQRGMLYAVSNNRAVSHTVSVSCRHYRVFYYKTLRKANVIAEIANVCSHSYCGTLQHLETEICWNHCCDILTFRPLMSSIVDVPHR